MALVITILIAICILGLFAIAIYYSDLGKVVFSSHGYLLDRPSNINEIFYKYKHKSARDWYQWLKNQEYEVIEVAYEMLKDHLEANPRKWSMVTLEVLNILPKFEKFGNYSLVTDFFLRLNENWDKFKIIPSCATKAMEVMATLDPNQSMSILIDHYNYLAGDSNNTQSRRAEIIKVLFTLDFSHKLSNFFTNIITSEVEDFSTRKLVLDHIGKLKLNYKKPFYQKLIEIFNSSTVIPIPTDSNKYAIFRNLVQAYDKCIDNEYDLDVLLEAYNNDCLRMLVRQIIKMKVSDPAFVLSDLCLLHILNTDDEHLIDALTSRHNLTELERKIVRTPLIPEDLLEEESLRVEKISNEMPIPAALYNVHKFIEEALSISNSNKQTLEGKGLLLGGTASIQKLYQVRSIVKERRWSFVYVNVKNNDLNEACKTIVRATTNTPKPYVIYIDDYEPFLKQYKQEDEYYISITKANQALGISAVDPKVFIVAAVEENIDYLNEESFIASSIDQRLFSNVLNLNRIEGDEYKIKAFYELSKDIDPERKDKDLAIENIVGEVTNSSPLELQGYLTQYFQMCLLIKGKLLSRLDYCRLKANKDSILEQQQANEEARRQEVVNSFSTDQTTQQ